jgi:soluble lytic murein transglycosylase-like protein
MKRLAAVLLSLLVLLTCASAQSISEYLKYRKKLGITQAVGVEALETMLGTRVVEVQGNVKGTVTVSGGSCILLEKTDGQTMFVHGSSIPDWLTGNTVPVRLLLRAERESAGQEIKATLIAAAPEAPIADMEAQAARRPMNFHTSRTRSRSAHLAMSGPIGEPQLAAGRSYSLPASEATPIYANFIKRRNARLSPNEAYRIAEGVVGFSLKYGVDARLIMAMLMVESGFNPNATSRTGAMGLGQLMPGTAAGMGVTNAYDSIDNLYGTVKLIHGHLERYQQETGQEYHALVLALAAYNAGSGAVSRHGGVPPYRETQNYVRKVIGIYRQLSGR